MQTLLNDALVDDTVDENYHISGGVWYADYWVNPQHLRLLSSREKRTRTDIEAAFRGSCGTTKKDLTHSPAKMVTEKVLEETNNAQMTQTTISRPAWMWKMLNR